LGLNVNDNEWGVCMKVDGVYYNIFFTNNLEKDGNFNKVNSSKLIKKNKITFRNRPWQLNPNDFGVSRYGSISANEAIRLHSQLKLGNYLDIGNDYFDFYNCNLIREENLNFLNRIDYSSDKREFIEYYKNLTGFPDLEVVSQKIENEFASAVEKSQQDLSYINGANVLLAGYDGVCSVGRKKAFPGSDIDKAYAILQGTGWQYEENELLNQFKGRLWNNTDQRILSYNHDEAAFPQIYTKRQIETLTKAIDEKDECHRKPWLNKVNMRASDAVKEQSKYLYNSNGVKNPKYIDDYVEANPFWIRYCKEFLKSLSDTVDIYNPSRENIKNVGFIIESIREGKVLKGSKKYLEINKYISYYMANLSQLAALKRMPDKKSKRLERNSLKFDFPRWDLEKQFRFIQTLIKSACANNREFTYEFSKYFSKPGQDLFAPLIKAMMR